MCSRGWGLSWAPRFHFLTLCHVSQDYTWEDHGYSLIQRLYPEGGQLLDEKFQAAYSLTYNTMAMHSGVDTSMLRRAIWNYIHCVFGIRSVRSPSPGLCVRCKSYLHSQLFLFSLFLSSCQDCLSEHIYFFADYKK